MNLILITADEMRADCAGFMGHPLCRTPNMDRLAARGAVFENHFTVHGKCVPSRASMLTGRYTHTDGFRAINHECTIPDGAPNLHLFLKNLGYETAFFGHNHTHENLLNGRNRKGESIADYHSFTEGTFDHLLKREWPVPPQRHFPPPPPDQCHAYGCVTKPRTGFCDDNRAEQAVHYLRHVRDRSRPFYLHLNFGMPHPPYRVEEPWFSMYDRAQLTPYPLQLPRNAPLPLRQMHACRGGPVFSETAARELLATYLGMISKVDMLLGRVLDAVDAEDLWRDTIVVFTSDHGDFAGQYSLPEKWDSALQDCLLRVPFILCAPGIAGGARVSGLSEHVDIPSTVLELLGREPEPQWGIHGASMLPTLRGGPGKPCVFADGGHEEAMIRRFNTPVRKTLPDGSVELTTHGKQLTYGTAPDAMARAKMARTAGWKLVMRLAGGNELYHVASDPFELDNLHDDPGHEAVKLQLLQHMVDWSLRTDTDRPFLEQVGA